MNTIVKNKLITYFVVLLLVVNSIAMGMYWWQQYSDAHPKPNTKDNQGASAFLMDKLKFDSVQLGAFKKLQQTHQQAIKAVKDSMHFAKDNFFNLLEKDSVTEQELSEAASITALKQIQLDRITFQFFKSVQQLCTPEQKIIFQEVIKEALRIMGRPAPPPGGRRPGGPRGQSPNDGPPREGPPGDGPPHDGPPNDGPPQ
jgi:Spy/CpxP family protein refolding chaperone